MKNMGFIDRIIRLIIAGILFTLYLLGIISGSIGIGLIIVAVVFFLTSMVSVCPLYLPFGWKTTGKKVHSGK